MFDGDYEARSVAVAEFLWSPRDTGRVSAERFIVLFSPLQVQGQPLMVQVSGGQLITSTGQPIMVQAVPGGQGQTIMQVPVSGTQGLQQVSQPPSYRRQTGENEPSRSRRADSAFAAALKTNQARPVVLRPWAWQGAAC